MASSMDSSISGVRVACARFRAAASVRRPARVLLFAACTAFGIAPLRLAAQSPAAAQAVTGDSAWSAGDRKAALQAYARAVALDAQHSSRAVYRLGVLLAENDRLPEALVQLRHYVRMEPRDSEGVVTLARTLAWAGRYDESLATYEALLLRDRTYRDAALGAAQTQSWAGRSADAVQRYRAWLSSNPGDGEAELALARALSWGGDLAAAESAYAVLASRGTAMPDAEKGIARVAAWRGDLVRSERLWRAFNLRHPADPEGWTGLAQVLRWTGRPALAASALRSALAAEPGYGDARTQLRWVEADLRPAADPTVVYSNDSDRNSSTLYSAQGSVLAPWGARVLVGASARLAELPQGAAITRGQSYGGRIATRWAPLAGRVTFGGELGVRATRSERAGDAPVPSRTFLVAGARVGAQPWQAITLGLGVSRAPFDETAALIRSGIVTTSTDADLSIALPARLSLSAGVGHTALAGDTSRNTRLASSVALRWSPRRTASLGVAARGFGYDREAREGYFAPRRYQLTELNARASLGRELGWDAEIEGGLGAQRITPWAAGATVNARRAERLAGGVIYRFAPGMELGLTAGYANVAPPQAVEGETSYRAYTLALRGRLTL